MIKYEAGTVHPDEYNWREQFALEGVIEPSIKMDVGKVRGMAIALDEALAKKAELKAECERLKEAIKHAARILSFGGDVEVMHYLQEAIRSKRNERI